MDILSNCLARAKRLVLVAIAAAKEKIKMCVILNSVSVILNSVSVIVDMDKQHKKTSVTTNTSTTNITLKPDHHGNQLGWSL